MVGEVNVKEGVRRMLRLAIAADIILISSIIITSVVVIVTIKSSSSKLGDGAIANFSD